MRKALLMMLAVAITGTAWAGDRTVTACLGRDARVSAELQWLAQGYATRLYKAIGVELRWDRRCDAAEKAGLSTPNGNNPHVISMEWASVAPPNASPKAYAAARPFQTTGTRITLFVDRLKPVLEEPSLGAAVLGHVLAHEIGHVLLGHDGHSEKGLMKARWNANDRRGMNYHLLPFSLDTADSIRQSLDGYPPVG